MDGDTPYPWCALEVDTNGAIVDNRWGRCDMSTCDPVSGQLSIGRFISLSINTCHPVSQVSCPLSFGFSLCPSIFVGLTLCPSILLIFFFFCLSILVCLSFVLCPLVCHYFHQYLSVFHSFHR